MSLHLIWKGAKRESFKSAVFIQMATGAKGASFLNPKSLQLNPRSHVTGTQHLGHHGLPPRVHLSRRLGRRQRPWDANCAFPCGLQLSHVADTASPSFISY